LVERSDPGRGRTKKGYFWVLNRDDGPWCGRALPAVEHSYALGRGGTLARRCRRAIPACCEPTTMLAIASSPPRSAPRASNARVLLGPLAQTVVRPCQITPAPIAAEALRRIAELYALEVEIRGKSAISNARCFRPCCIGCSALAQIY